MAGNRRPFAVAYAVLALVACASAAAVFGFTRGAPDTATPAEAATPIRFVKTAVPTASDFAETFAGTANAYAESNGSRSRIAKVHCVTGKPGHYMCSYAVVRPSREPECHIMQARLTPNELSSFQVTLSGRAARCGSLREAIGSLS